MVTLRQKAKDKGEMWYKSDSTCIHGHVNPIRYTMTSGCQECIRGRHSKKFNLLEWIKNLFK